MNKNTILGFVVIGAIMFGFSWYQSKQAKERIEQEQSAKKEQVMQTLEAKAIAAAEDMIAESSEVQAETNEPEMVDLNVQTLPLPYKDTLLNSALHDVNLNPGLSPQFATLSNDLTEITFTTQGAQPFSVKLKEYTAYNPEDPDKPKELYLIKNGESLYNISMELSAKVSGESDVLNTNDFIFQIVPSEAADTVMMRLPYGGGYIQQKYWLPEDSYMLHNELSFVGLDNIVDNITDTYRTDWKLYIPRLEKGYKNEKQYSKLDYYYSGEEEVEQIARGRDESANVSSRIRWFAFQQQFFSAILTPDQQFDNAKFNVRFADEAGYAAGDLMHCEAVLKTSFDPGLETMTFANEFYLGPNDYKTLKSYDRHYEEIIPLGSWIVSWFSKWVIIPVFDFLGKFISNYGIIILLMTIFIKLLLTPLTLKSYKSTAKMQVLKPEIDKLNEKYPKQEDAMKKQQAMMNLYQKAGVSPMGGCLPMLLQMPILFAMFRFFPASIELRQQSFLWADDLSAYDSIIEFGGSIPLLGDHISLFALLMALSMFFYTKLSSAQMADGGMPGMKFMSLYLMPIMMFFICNSLSSALSYYYLLSNLITMGMTWYIRKYVVTEDKVRAAMAAAATKPRQKSKWQMRLEEAQRMQEQMQKQNRNRR